MKDVHGGNIWEAASVLPGKGRILDFSASINPLGTPPSVVSAILAGLDMLSPYPDPQNIALRNALSDFHSNGIEPCHVLPCNGSTEAIHLLPRVFKPHRVLIAEPAFSEYRASLASSGAVVNVLKLKEADGWALNLGRLDSALARGYDLFYIANPANPTGALIDKDTLISVARVCAKRKTIMVVDEAFVDFCEHESLKREAIRLENVIVLRSMTKFYSMAGLRLGYVVACERLIKKLGVAMAPWSVNTLASFAGQAALKDTAYHGRTLEWFEKERVYLAKGLGSLSGVVVYPSAANFFMARLSGDYTNAALLKQSLFERRILIRELGAFPCLGQGYFRVAIRTRAENNRLLSVLSKVLTSV
ncbi:MAG: threonine-phosphate decarboxylase [Deltaproteobacteria bacterium]|nr:threonine-phosphate decarboxylase [Deltaproteobacteria bacterium]